MRISRAFPILAALLLSLSAQAAELKTWRQGILTAKADAGIVLMAAKRGFAEKQGLAIEIVEMRDDPTLIRALLSGDVDGIEGGPGVALLAGARGADVRMLGCYWTTLPHGVFVRPEIRTVADLRGKTFAIAGPSGAPDLVARALLDRYDVPIASVQLANLGGDADRYKALVAGVAQATVVSLEYVPVGGRDGIKLLLPAREVLPNYIRTCTDVTARTLAARRDDAITFVAAEMTALHFAVTHRDETLALTREVTGMSPNDPRPDYIYQDAVRNNDIDPDMGLPIDKLRWMQDLLLNIGNLPSGVDLGTITAPEIRAAALAQNAAKAGQPPSPK